MHTWSLQDAKARLSELVNLAQTEGPQMVSRRGKEAVVIISAEEYRKSNRKRSKKNLVEALRCPVRGLPQDLFDRDRDMGRDIEL